MGLTDYYWGFISFIGVSWAFETYLSLRQFLRCGSTEVPVEITGQVTADEFRKANAYAREKCGLNIVKSAFDLLVQLAMLYVDALPWLWDVSLHLGQRYLWSAMEAAGIPHSLVFMLVTHVLNLVVELPWGLYTTFVVEARHGFNKQTLPLFFSDLVKGTVLMVVLGLPIMGLVIWIVEAMGDYFYWYLLAFMVTVSLLASFIYPNFIQPWFNKFSALEEGDLKRDIEALASRIGFPLTKLYVVDGSKRSGHSNAYMYGFWKNKRIVLFDTLLENMKGDRRQILAVLAHELGHWKFGHTLKQLGIGVVYMFAMFYTFAVVNTSNDVYSMFGFHLREGDRRPTMIGLSLFMMFIWSPIDHVISFTMNAVSRHFEQQADAYSVLLGYAEPLKAGLVILNVSNKGSMDPDPLFSTYHHSHPPLIHRLRYINECLKKRL